MGIFLSVLILAHFFGEEKWGGTNKFVHTLAVDFFLKNGYNESYEFYLEEAQP